MANNTGGVEGQGSAPSSQIAQFRSDGITASSGLRIPFFADAFSRAFGMPAVFLGNMMSEATPLREERPYVPFVGLREVRYSRPAMVTGFNCGTGPIRGGYWNAGVFGGAAFQVSGNAVFMNGSNVGTIPGQDLVRWAASPAQLVLVADGAAWIYDGATYSTFTQISNGVLPAVVDVAYLADRFVFIAAGSDVFWYSELYDATNVQPLDFAANSDSPAPTVAAAVLNDQVVMFGADTVEFWSPNTDATQPFLPNEGRGFQRGCASRDTVQFADNALFWVGNNGVVYRIGNAPDRISSSSIEDAIRRCPFGLASLSAFVATFEGHELYVLNIPGIGSYAYDISRIGTVENAYGDSYSRGEWNAWSSWNHPQFRGRTAVVVGAQTYVGDDTTNDLWLMQEGVYTDAGGPLVREAFAFIKIEEGRPRMSGLALHCTVGVGTQTAPGVNPVVEMRYSDDLGRTFSRWRAAPLGAQGAYRTRPYWQRLGLMRAPGRLLHIRISDPVNVALSHLELNPLRAAN